jgi:hypothetical protein
MPIRYGHVVSKLSVLALLGWIICFVFAVVAAKSFWAIGLYAGLAAMEIVNTKCRSSLKTLWFRLLNARRPRLKISFNRNSFGDRCAYGVRFPRQATDQEYYEKFLREEIGGYVEVAHISIYASDPSIRATLWFQSPGDAVAFKLRNSESDIEFVQ